MEILIGFSLGIVTALLVIMSIAMVKLVKRAQDTERFVNTIPNDLSELKISTDRDIERIFRKIDEETKETYLIFEEKEKNLESQIRQIYDSFDEVYRSIDSRFDRFENKVKGISSK